MRRPLKLVALIALSLLTGCTSLQAVQPEQTLDKVNQLDVGSRLIVYEKSGRRIDMRFVRMDEHALYGSLTQDGLHAIKVIFEDIEAIETEQIDGLKTSLAAAAGIVLLPIFALGAGAVMVDELN